MINIYNEDCFITMNEHIDDGSIDLILTSPFYNTNKHAAVKSRDGHDGLTLDNTITKDGVYPNVRYDVHCDNLTNDEYCEFTKKLFLGFDRILKENGVVLYNISYGAENTDGMFRAINTIITETPFTVADVIVWKKKSAFPNSCSSNKLTRVCEFVFVFCRRSEFKTFYCNKSISSYRETGQPAYENIFNIIEARNNDEMCPHNKATYSTELCHKLMDIYCPDDATVYDPFMGSGTTAVACKQRKVSCIGSEISKKQCEWAENRIKGTPVYNKLW